MLSSRNGELGTGSGFFINAYTLATSWSVVGRQCSGVRVTVTQASGAPVILDGVVVFAMPAQDVAFVAVNPAFAAGTSFAPVVLSVNPSVAVGDAVFTVGTPFAASSYDSSYPFSASYIDGPFAGSLIPVAADTFSAGYVQSVGQSTLGYFSNIQVDIAAGAAASPGAPIIRFSDGAIVGMQTANMVSGTILALHPRVLAAAVKQALNAITTSKPWHLGAATAPALVGGPVLAQTITSAYEAFEGATGPAVGPIPVPMPTAAVGQNVRGETTLAPLGSIAAGAWVVSPQLDLSPDLTDAGSGYAYPQTASPYAFWGNAVLSGQAYTSPAVVYNFPVIDDASQSVGYFDPTSTSLTGLALGAGVAVSNLSQSFQSIVGSTGTVWCNPLMDDQGAFSLRSLLWGGSGDTGPAFRVSVTPSADPYVLAQTVPAQDIQVSALGMVQFETAAYATNMDTSVITGIVLQPTGGENTEIVWASPFTCGDFQLGRGGYTGVTGAGPLQELPGLGVYVLGSTGSGPTGSGTGGTGTSVVTTVVVEWIGRSVLDNNPVNFQAWLSFEEGDDLEKLAYAGQTSFRYGTMPGTWPGGPWLAGTSMTTKAVSRGQYSCQPILLPRQPVPDDVAYFGVHSFTNNIYLPVPPRSVVPDPTTTQYMTIVAPTATQWPPYQRGSFPGVPNFLTPGATGTVGQAQGTAVVIAGSTDAMWYQPVSYTWLQALEPQRVVAVGGVAVGTTDSDATPLTAALTAVNPTASAAVPTAIQIVTQSYDTAGVGPALPPLGVLQLTSTATPLGSPRLAVNMSSIYSYSASGFVFNPTLASPAIAADEYGAVIMATPVQQLGNVTLASLTIPAEYVDQNVLFVLQYGVTDSSTLDTEYGYPSVSGVTGTDQRCIYLYSDDSETPVFTFAVGSSLDAPPVHTETVPLTAGACVVSPTTLATWPLFYNAYEARTNALVTGRPPRGGNTRFLGTKTLTKAIVTFDTVEAWSPLIINTTGTGYAVSSGGVTAPAAVY